LPAAYGPLPLSFEANQGQTDTQVQFLAHGPGYGVLLTGDQAVLNLRGSGGAGQTTGTSLSLRLAGANATPPVTGQDKLAGVANYLVGNDPGRWHLNVPTYARVQYQNVYAGIDLAYHGSNQQRLEYDFLVHPGADPGVIRLAFSGQQGMALEGQGDLVLHTGAGDVIDQAPVLYQQSAGGTRSAVAGQYVLEGDGTVGFRVGAYDPTRDLVIDPTLAYSFLLGAAANGGSSGHGIAVDAGGDAYLTGSTSASNFPTTTGAFQTTFGGGPANAFVAKLNPAGTALVYSTYLGGNGADVGNAIAVDSSGNAYITGQTSSTNFPTTPGAFQTSFGGSAIVSTDVFVTKLNATGTALGYSTYLGSNNRTGDDGLGIAVDGAGDAFVTGQTSGGVPTTTGAFQTILGGTLSAFVTQVNPSGSNLVYSTYVGTDSVGRGIAVESSGFAWITGSTTSPLFPTTGGPLQASFQGGTSDAFVTELGTAGADLIYSTYLGGSGTDQGNGIALDNGGVYVTGFTTSNNFPVTAGAFQTSLRGTENAFVTKLNPSFSNPIYSTYLGGSGFDRGFGIAVDRSGDAFVTGDSSSNNFPTTADAFQASSAGGPFVTQLNPAGTALRYSTYFSSITDGGSAGNGIAVDGSGNAYIAGHVEGSDHAFVAKFTIGPSSNEGGGGVRSPIPVTPPPDQTFILGFLPPLAVEDSPPPRRLQGVIANTTQLGTVVPGEQDLLVLGTHFAPGSVLSFPGVSLQTEFIDSSHLIVPHFIDRVVAALGHPVRLRSRPRRIGHFLIYQQALLMAVLRPGNADANSQAVIFTLLEVVDSRKPDTRHYAGVFANELGPDPERSPAFSKFLASLG
jgi:hypothetical protein